MEHEQMAQLTFLTRAVKFSQKFVDDYYQNCFDAMIIIW